MEKKKKIIFIEAKSPGAHIFSRVLIPRLGAILLGTILRDKGYDVSIYVEDMNPVNMEDVLTADYVGISTITSTAVRAYELGDQVRKAGIPVIMGGPHVSFMPEEALEHADYVIRGEGEYSLVELVKALDTNGPIEGIQGLSYKKDGSIINNERGEYECDLDKFPAPDYSLVVGWSKKNQVASIATSRGCPFGCRFCSVIHMFGRKLRFRSIDKVIEEVKELAPKVRHIFFCDDNFVMSKKRTKELLQRIIDEGIKFQWSTQLRVDAAKDEELLQLMKKAGCYTVFIGFESVNPKTLEAYEKQQSIADIKFAIKKFHQYGIHIHGMFVVGSDQDDVETINLTTEFAQSTGIDTVQFMMLTPLPGTPMFEDLKNEGRIFNWDWSKYDAHHTLFEPKNMSAYELQTETLKAMKNFYTFNSALKYLLKGDLFYMFITYWGRKHAIKALKEKQEYAEYLKTHIQNKYLASAEQYKDALGANETPKLLGITNFLLEEKHRKFLPLFLQKLGYKVVSIDKEAALHPKDKELTEKEILPFLENCKKHFTKFADKADYIIMPIAKGIGESFVENKHKLDEAIKKLVNNIPKKCIHIEISDSNLYKTCTELGITLNANIYKIRKAYKETIQQLNLKDIHTS